jgi:hypothetical protein
MPDTQYPTPRRYQRAQIFCPLTLCYGGALERVVATSLNEGGLMVLSRAPVALSPRLHLIFELPDGRIIEADGEVCAPVPEIGFGIKFTNLAPQHRQEIARVVQATSSEQEAPAEQPPNAEPGEEWKKLRSEPRVTMSFSVQLESQDETGETFSESGQACDVSRHGAGVWVRRPYEVGQQVQLIGPGKKFTAPAVVRNCAREGSHWKIGLRLLAVPDEWVIK